MSPEVLHLDYNAGAPPDEEALEVFLRTARALPGNPSSLHRLGRRARAVLEDAREEIGALLGTLPRELVFTSGATEANNLALLGVARAARSLGTPLRLIASEAEHPSVLAPLRRLQQEGHPLELLPIGRDARVREEALAAALARPGPALLALQWAGNETGCLQPLGTAVAGLREDLHLHVDAVQGFGKLPLAPELEAASTWSLSGHKFGAPRGCGLLRVQEGVFLESLQAGGGQERGLRPGTECPAHAAALATALRRALERQEDFARETASAARALLQVLDREGVEYRSQHPPPGEGLPNTLSLSFPGTDGRALLLACDAEGLAVSSGSACASGAAQPSAVLLAAGLSEAEARATLRISFGRPSGATLGEEAGRRLATILRRSYEARKP